VDEPILTLAISYGYFSNYLCLVVRSVLARGTAESHRIDGRYPQSDFSGIFLVSSFCCSLVGEVHAGGTGRCARTDAR
jgi:hypothetical protein